MTEITPETIDAEIDDEEYGAEEGGEVRPYASRS
jgi:hypothetical protein